MDTSEVTAILIASAARIFNKEESSIQENTRIAEELGTKSLDRMGMCASIENEFDVIIPFADFGKYKTIAELAEFIAEQLA